MSLDLEVVTDGLGFPEGPVAMADGSLLFVDIKNETLSRVGVDGRVDVVARDSGRTKRRGDRARRRGLCLQQRRRL